MLCLYIRKFSSHMIEVIMFILICFSAMRISWFIDQNFEALFESAL